jgi:hypothetical protein
VLSALCVGVGVDRRGLATRPEHTTRASKYVCISHLTVVGGRDGETWQGRACRASVRGFVRGENVTAMILMEEINVM